MRKLIRRIRRWNLWRKEDFNGFTYELLVLFGVIHTPTFRFTLLPDEKPGIRARYNYSLDIDRKEK